MKTSDCRFGDTETMGDFLSLWLEKPLLDAEYQKIFETYYHSYKRSFGARMRASYSEQIGETLALVRSNPGSRVLEVGFGLGTESLWLAMHGAHVLAIDILGDFRDVAHRRKALLEENLGRPLHCEFRRVSVMDLEDDGFDVIWMEQTFHHLEPRDRVIDKIVSLVKPGGYIVISEANALNLLLQLQLFIARGFNMYFTHVDEDGKEILIGRERIVTARYLRAAFGRRRVRCRSIRYFRVFPNRPIFDGLGRLERWLARNCLAPLQAQFNYVGQRE